MKNRIRPPVKIDANGRVIRDPTVRAVAWRLNVPASVSGTKKERLFFKTEKEAKQKGEELLALRRGTSSDKIGELAKRGMTIEKAIQYALDHAPILNDMTVTVLTEKYASHRKKEIRIGERYAATLESYLKRIRETLGSKKIGDVKKQQIRDFLDGLKGRDGTSPASPDTRNHYLETFRAVFNFAKEEGYLSRSPVDGISKSQTDDEDVEILSLDDVQKLLGVIWEKEHAEVAPAALIQLFAAPRRSEIPLVSWDLFVGQYLRLDKVKRGTKKRATEVPSTLIEWLAPFRKLQGYVFDPAGIDVDRQYLKSNGRGQRAEDAAKALRQLEDAYTNRLERLAQAAGVNLPKNVLRHTAITMKVNRTGDLEATARWAGNSPAVIEEHYLGVASPEDAAHFYALRPSLPVLTKDL